MSFTMQKQSARNLLLSTKIQTTAAGALADANLTTRQVIDASTVFTPANDRANDKDAVGKGTEFATVDILTAWNAAGSIKANGLDAWFAGYALSLLFGQETVTGPGPYTHTFTIPNITSTMPLTTVYVEETNDVKRKLTMAAKTLSLTIPKRGFIDATLDMVGTGHFFDGALGIALPALVTPEYLLGSDFIATITPSGDAAVSFSGRQESLAVKIDRQSSAFESSGDGLQALSVVCGDTKFSVDLTVDAQQTDDVNGWFESMTPLSITLQTNPAKAYQVGFSFPLARVRANKLGNAGSRVTWALSFDETTCLQNGAQAAISAFVINDCPAYLTT